jgi:hypothetical protein
MKRSSEMMHSVVSLQVLSSVDLLSHIAIGNLSPSDLVQLLSTAKPIMHACLSNAIWQEFIGGLLRPQSFVGEMYRTYRNLAVGNFVLEESFPSATLPKHRGYFGPLLWQ